LPDIFPATFSAGAVPDNWTETTVLPGFVGFGISTGVGHGQFVYAGGSNDPDPAGGNYRQTSIGANVNAFGDIYTLTFDVSTENVGTGSWTAKFLVDGATVATSTPVVLAGVNAWSSHSFEWTADTLGALGIQFDFELTSAAPQNLFLDNVGLSYEPVPEPSTVALSIVGLSGMLLARRKRKE
jgi:hypothetical protein